MRFWMPMAWATQCHAIIDRIANLWELCVRLDVMRVHPLGPPKPAPLTSVIIAAFNTTHPGKILSVDARVLRRAALPIPMALALHLVQRTPSQLADAFFQVLRGLLAASQRWSRDAGLRLRNLSKLFRSPTAHTPLMPITETAMLAALHVSLRACVRDDRSGLTATAFANHVLNFTTSAA